MASPMATAEVVMTYIDPGAGSLLIQALGGALIGLVATLGSVRRFFQRRIARWKGRE